jgi:RHS repeat-associated protein
MVWDVTRSTLGARGIDMIARQRMLDKENPNPGTASRVFPLYDGHGNTMGELARTGGTSYAVGNLRKYDAWGNSRLNSAQSGFHGYSGNLGHKEDPESGLTYMRARYYEPGTGRFISEDPAHDGLN